MQPPFRTLVAPKLEAFVEELIPDGYEERLRYEYEVTARQAVLFEVRPQAVPPAAWTRLPVARIRRARGLFVLDWCDRGERWRRYERLPPTADVDVVLDEILEDPVGVFLG